MTHPTLDQYPARTLARFEKYIDRSGPVPEHVPELGACHVWIGGRHAKGYGLFQVRTGYTKRAHRMMYEIAHGEIPDGMLVMHDCDNPCCVNPSHLRAGSTVDNVADKVSKRRHCHGERNGRAKLTADDVCAIRASALATAELAKQYGVAKCSIRDARGGRTWKSV